ncbi:GNAT family N-acetyltransferase [uncultured Roseibium sp.]|uniref:GNAT family N-acetyltransferase n=1 Tax=uncultured Roseibium sp. TaxID=1936171 RepID=UPI00262A023F|nr:GNAT family N-acetyltransferase [uncultured Roseibium sp.]
MAFKYRRLDAEHAAQWQALRLEGARDFPLGFLVTLEETEATSLERAGQILGAGAQRGIFEQDELVGFCGFRRTLLQRMRHRAEVGPFFVTSGYQGTDAASQMMSGVIEEARSKGVEQLELFVDTQNARAIRFYERLGFERAATYRDSVRIDGVSHDDYFMTLRLAGQDVT